MVYKILISHCRTLTPRKDAVLDMEGYHSHHRKERSDQTVTASDDKEGDTSPSSPDLTPGPSSMPHYHTYSPFAYPTLEIFQDLVLHLPMDQVPLLRQ